jgi:serine/threonine protein kinase
VFIKQLGMGKYGRVGLMIHKETGFICAVKTLNKKLIIEEEISDTILQ